MNANDCRGQDIIDPSQVKENPRWVLVATPLKTDFGEAGDGDLRGGKTALGEEISSKVYVFR